MKQFILGYPYNVDPIVNNLVECSSKDEAAFMAEEWCIVTANAIEEAKQNYEAQFTLWQQKANTL